MPSAYPWQPLPQHDAGGTDLITRSRGATIEELGFTPNESAFTYAQLLMDLGTAHSRVSERELAIQLFEERHPRFRLEPPEELGGPFTRALEWLSR